MRLGCSVFPEQAVKDPSLLCLVCMYVHACPVRALPSVSVVVHPVCSDPVLGCHCHCPHVFRCSETPNGVFSLLFVFAFGLRILHWARLGRPVRPFHYHLRSIFCSMHLSCSCSPSSVCALLVIFVLSSSCSCSSSFLPLPRVRVPVRVRAQWGPFCCGGIQCLKKCLIPLRFNPLMGVLHFSK